jgi:hypothetical protein
LKASELDPNLFPPQEVVKAFEKVGHEYERTCHDRAYQEWFYPLMTAEPVAKQDIKKSISQLYRIKDSDGKEWLFYNVDLSGNDWKGNRKDFSYLEGVIEGMPIFNYEVEPSTNKVVPGTTQVLEVIKKYTIPFKKEKVEELSKHFRNPVGCVIVARDGRKYSVSLEQFKSMAYSELIDMVTGFADFMANRRNRGQLKEGGVN